MTIDDIWLFCRLFSYKWKEEKKTFGVLLCQKKCDDMRETAGDK